MMENVAKFYFFQTTQIIRISQLLGLRPLLPPPVVQMSWNVITLWDSNVEIRLLGKMNSFQEPTTYEQFRKSVPAVFLTE